MYKLAAVLTSASTISSRRYLLTMVWVLATACFATSSNSSSTGNVQAHSLELVLVFCGDMKRRLWFYLVRTRPGTVAPPGTRDKGAVLAARSQLMWTSVDLGSELRRDPSSAVEETFAIFGGRNTQRLTNR